MTLKKWIEDYGRGAVSHLARESGVARTTVEKAARGEAVSVPKAKALSAATGGQVTVFHLAGML